MMFMGLRFDGFSHSSSSVLGLGLVVLMDWVRIYIFVFMVFIIVEE